jgi:hypothetical protein
MTMVMQIADIIFRPPTEELSPKKGLPRGSSSPLQPNLKSADGSVTPLPAYSLELHAEQVVPEAAEEVVELISGGVHMQEIMKGGCKSIGSW